MALVLNDRVKETSTTTGTGTFSLGGAVDGFETFVAGIANGNTTYYAAVNRDADEFEVGIGTVTDASPDTLARTTIISSSNSDSAVDFSAGTKDIFTTLPASKAIFEDASDDVTVGNDLILGSDSAVLKFGADSDTTLTHTDGTGLTLNSTNKLLFRDSALYINSSTDGQLDIVADTEVQIAATTIDINGAVALNGAITGATNITLSGELDAATLDISGDADIDGTLEADAITINGATLAETVTDLVGGMVSSNTETGITVTFQDADNTLDFALGAAQTTITSLLATDIKIGEDDQTKIDFETADEIHFYAANVEQVYLGDNIFGPQSDSDVDLGATGVRWKDAYVDSITVTGEVDAVTLDISGNADIDGTTNLDAVDIDGAVQLDATLTIGANDQGYDVILYGDTASANMTWDTSADDLIFNGAAGLIVPDGQFTLGSTAVTSTAAEINLIDGGTSRGTTAVASGDGILINDGGTMRMTNVDTVSTYFAGHSVGGSNIVTTGALDSGSITSGFGTIDTGSSTITTTGLISGGSLDIDNVLINGTTIGHTDDTDLITVADGLVTVAGEISVTTLDIGGTNVTSTAAELNYSDLATLGTSAASKVLSADANNLTKITGAVYLQEDTLSFDATQDWDVRASPVAKVTLTNNVTFDAPTNPTTGQYIAIVCIQDGTGSRTIAWNAVFEFKDDTAPTATTTANKGDLFTFRYNGAKWLEVGRNLNLTLS
jgi:cytoskeletal protein CcmA (bactofilin family)